MEEAAAPATPGDDDEGEESCKKKEKKCYIRKRQPFARSFFEWKCVRLWKIFTHDWCVTEIYYEDCYDLNVSPLMTA